ncbi:hypothetical protein CONLIGDRAFT_649923 [Coniochaeta ligniaria NRRL 30616]|uniref:Uncharacterized protein n=1 Tax=Coniochaeta ligniaria NRRL 30616 TaxID=1408157 RepID=A0A1J7IPP4_9PEZI|nr:hypothetical protein CONLIGDRAFT_649923 [Coniochaeta ligniaria NRRL 30616]
MPLPIPVSKENEPHTRVPPHRAVENLNDDEVNEEQEQGQRDEGRGSSNQMDSDNSRHEEDSDDEESSDTAENQHTVEKVQKAVLGRLVVKLDAKQAAVRVVERSTGQATQVTPQPAGDQATAPALGEDVEQAFQVDTQPAGKQATVPSAEDLDPALQATPQTPSRENPCPRTNGAKQRSLPNTAANPQSKKKETHQPSPPEPLQRANAVSRLTVLVNAFDTTNTRTGWLYPESLSEQLHILNRIGSAVRDSSRKQDLTNLEAGLLRLPWPSSTISVYGGRSSGNNKQAAPHWALGEFNNLDGRRYRMGSEFLAGYWRKDGGFTLRKAGQGLDE